jgi:hypothetical protein
MFPFPLVTAFLTGIVWTNRGSGVKMFLSVLTAPIVLARTIDFLIRRCNVHKPHSHPANSIRHAYSRYEYTCANILALTYPFRHYKKFATLRLFVKTMPIYKAVASGNGNIEFCRETTCSNLK